MPSSSEIVFADPVDVEAAGSSWEGIRWEVTFSEGGSDGQGASISSLHVGGSDHNGNIGPEPFESERLLPTLAGEIQRFLRVANLIEPEQPRIAYLCRFYAFEVAHNLDQNSSGRGVRQFKTSLLERLEQYLSQSYFSFDESEILNETRFFVAVATPSANLSGLNSSASSPQISLSWWTRSIGKVSCAPAGITKFPGLVFSVNNATYAVDWRIKP